ncbi:forkhead box protein N3-like isoform X2 [Xyrauchen texanus]|uniref:forkhead box protein N3-like isoform X2 n=1 Tax=Xyrauchen texanus TaxID=154827 RepID=UPI0022426413|nr:forkhead box protein N3-like isoform X2 [Xyrauchen texanus]
MGPVMPPSKKPEGTGVSVVRGLSQFYQASSFTCTLQEAEDIDLAVPTIKLEKGSVEDEELTNLNWLHESKNLLNSFGDPVLRSVSPVLDLDDDTPPSPAHSDLPYDTKQNPNCKPPYSFSCLIFMAIEDAPSKRLPVKDIYNWILEHFPYFANAPTGWKNSVRHNLSLNKCFKKVDKDRSQSIGKGSLWCIDPEYRQNLIQALKKTPYHPYSQVFTMPPTSPQAYQSMSSTPVWPESPFYRKNKGVLLQEERTLTHEIVTSEAAGLRERKMTAHFTSAKACAHSTSAESCAHSISAESCAHSTSQSQVSQSDLTEPEQDDAPVPRKQSKALDDLFGDEFFQLTSETVSN